MVLTKRDLFQIKKIVRDEMKKAVKTLTVTFNKSLLRFRVSSFAFVERKLGIKAK